MADLQKTDAEWIRFLGKEIGGTQLAALRFLYEARDRFKLTRTQVAVDGLQAWATLVDWSGGGITLDGVDPGTNCAEDGRLWARITGTGPFTFSLYKASGGGGGDLVAQGSASAGGTATLTAQNSSGLSGTAELHASVAAETSDTFQILATVDFPARLRTVFDETVEDDRFTRKILDDAYAAVSNDLARAVATLLSFLPPALLSAPGNEQARGNDFASSAETTLASARAVDQGTAGGVTITRSGLLERLRLAMAEETTGSTQFVVRRNPSAGSTTFGSNNAGTYSVPTHSPSERCPALSVTFFCERGVDTGDLGNEAFRARFTITENGQERSFPADTLAVIGQPWSHTNGFGPITISRTLAKTGDGSNNVFTAASGATVTGENNTNTDAGVLYWETEANGSNWDVSFFSSSTRDASSLVAKASNVASGATFTATQKNGSNLQVVWELGGTESATTGTLDLQPPKVDADDNGTPDEFTIAVTATAPGLFQTLLSRALQAELNATTSGSETIKDEWVKQGTFPPFAVDYN